MTSVLAPVKTITLQGLAPDVIQSCVLAPAPPTPDPEPADAIYAPVAPGITYAGLPVVPAVVDTSPDQIIGCCNDVGTDPQGRLNALFPAAISGDGVVDRASNDIWVFDGATWNNVGPTPGPTLTVNSTIPPWNEIVVYDARVRTRLEVNGLAYALELLTEPAANGITLGLGVQTSQALIRVPAANTFTPSAHAPQISGGASVAVPAQNTGLAVLTPSVSAGKSINVPLLDIDFAASVVPYVGPLATVVQPPAANAALGILMPNVAAGKAIAIPALDQSLAAHVPQVNDEPPSVVLVGAQSAATTSIVLSLGTYLQNDVHLLVIETGGEGSTLTPPSPWDSVPGSPVTDVATTAGSKLQVWWQRAASNSTGTETVTIGDSGDHQLAVLFTIRGCATAGNPWDVTATSQKTTASLVSTAPSVTTNYGQTLVFSVVTRPNDSAATTFFNAPTNASLSGLTDQGEAGTALGHGGGFAASSGVLVYPGSTGVTTFTHGTSFTSTGFTIAFRP